MNRWTPFVALTVLGLGYLAVVQAEEITLQTYYPSPRGAFDQLLANRISSLADREQYFLDLEHGIVRTTEVVLFDPVSAKAYRVRIEGGRLVLVDPNLDRPYVILDLNQQP